jgi:hypothetical protein
VINLSPRQNLFAILGVAGIGFLKGRTGSSSYSSSDDFSTIEEVGELEEAIHLGRTSEIQTVDIFVFTEDDSLVEWLIKSVISLPNLVILKLAIMNEGTHNWEPRPFKSKFISSDIRLGHKLIEVSLNGIFLYDLKPFHNCLFLEKLEIEGTNGFTDQNGYPVWTNLEYAIHLKNLEEIDVTASQVRSDTLVLLNDHCSLKRIYGQSTWLSDETLPMTLLLDAKFEIYLIDTYYSIKTTQRDLVRVHKGDFKNEENMDSVESLIGGSDGYNTIIMNKSNVIRKF